MANRDLNRTERDALEALIDHTNLQAVLMALSEICDEKAEHIRTNWQDTSTARIWAEATGVIGLAVCEPTIQALSR